MFTIYVAKTKALISLAVTAKNHKADLCLCFRISKKLIFSRRGSYINRRYFRILFVMTWHGSSVGSKATWDASLSRLIPTYATFFTANFPQSTDLNRAVVSKWRQNVPQSTGKLSPGGLTRNNMIRITDSA